MRRRKWPLILVLLLLATFPLTASASSGQTPGHLDVRVPWVTNANGFYVDGVAWQGAAVQVEGLDVPVNPDGTFRSWVKISGSQWVTVTAADDRGNKSEDKTNVTYTKYPYGTTFMPYTALYLTAQPGTMVVNEDDPASQPFMVDASGQVRMVLPRLKLGGNSFWLKFTFPAPPHVSYYAYYYILKPFELDLPTETTLDNEKYSGMLLPGWTLTINGAPVAVDPSGRFEFQPKLAPGKNQFYIVATDPKGISQAMEATMLLQKLSLADAVRNGTLVYTLFAEPNSIAMVQGEVYVVGQSGQLAVPVPVADGTNEIKSALFSRDGSMRLGIYQFNYTSAPRKVRMNLGKNTAYVGEQAQSIPVAPQRIGDYTYVPLRFLAESLGATVSWNPDTHTATFTLKDQTVAVTIDSTVAVVNGVAKAMAAPARLVDGSTLVPVRFVSENLGATVDWNGATEEITITVN